MRRSLVFGLMLSVSLGTIARAAVPRGSFLGGRGEDCGWAVAFLPDGDILLAGDVNSRLMDPPTDPLQGVQAFVARVSPDLREVRWIHTVGGRSLERGIDIAVSADGSRVALVGFTDSLDFPAEGGAFPASRGSREGFLVLLDTANEVDPADRLLYSTHIGGSGPDTVTAVALHPELPIAYLTGGTSSRNFPVVDGAFQETYGGATTDTFVAVIDMRRELPPDEQLIYSSYLGGNGNDFGNNGNIFFQSLHQSIDVDADGIIVVAGRSSSRNLPATPGVLQETSGGGEDIVIARIRPDASRPPGEQLVALTYLGGTSDDIVCGVEYLEDGAIAVAGSTFNPYPATAGTFGRPRGGCDAVISVLDPDLSELRYSTVFGGPDCDRPWTFAAAPDGRFLIAGRTWSPMPLLTNDAFNTTRRGQSDAWLAVVDPGMPAGEQLIHSTLLGGTGIEGAWGVAGDPDGRIAVAGWTNSSDFLVGVAREGFQERFGGAFDAWVTVFDLRVPDPVLTADPLRADIPFTLELSAAGSTTPEGTTIEAYRWDIGGEIFEGEEVEYLVEEPGFLPVKLTVVNNLELESTTSVEVVAAIAGGDVTPWTATDLGDSDYPGTALFETSGESTCLRLHAGGAVASGTSDRLFFVHQSRDCDFEASVRIPGPTELPLRTQLGLMLRAGLDADAASVSLAVELSATALTRLRLRHRPVAGARATSIESMVFERDEVLANAWLRLRRADRAVEASTSLDGENWQPLGEVELDESFPREAEIGIVAAHQMRSFTELRPPISALACDVELECIDIPRFIRGEINNDGKIDVADPVYLLNWLATGGPALPCEAAGDGDGNGRLNITDAVRFLGWMFLGTTAPEPPISSCGLATLETDLELGCADPPPCSETP